MLIHVYGKYFETHTFLDETNEYAKELCANKSYTSHLHFCMKTKMPMTTIAIAVENVAKTNKFLFALNI